jgi:hypothetical protein
MNKKYSHLLLKISNISKMAAPQSEQVWGPGLIKISLEPIFPFIGELRCQAIQTEHGPYTV